MNYKNGNALITLESNGSRTIEYEGELSLEYPLNIDIRVSTQCSFGLNPKTNKAFCSFCHESATTDGKECNYEELKSKLSDLPKGIELAIGCNHYTQNLHSFLEWCDSKNYICNLTVNQGHLTRDYNLLKIAIDSNVVKGLGISYRKELKWNIPDFILNYENTVFHVISGIDTFKDIKNLSNKGVKKLLILGEKDFGFNKNKVNLVSRNHKEWYWWIHSLFNVFEVVSFDNLALEQLNIKRFFTKDNWDTFNQGEESFYINAISQYFAPSSRDSNTTSWNNLTVKEYFQQLL